MYLIKFYNELVTIYLQLVYQNIFGRVGCFSSSFGRRITSKTYTRNHQAWLRGIMLWQFNFFVEKLSNIDNYDSWHFSFFLLVDYFQQVFNRMFRIQRGSFFIKKWIIFLLTLISKWCGYFHLIAIFCFRRSFMSAFTHDGYWIFLVLSLINVFCCLILFLGLCIGLCWKMCLTPQYLSFKKEFWDLQ